jgi:hypothetical protein
MKRPYLVVLPEGATRIADFVFMHKDGGACFVDVGWDAPGRHPFHIKDGPIVRTENEWKSCNGTIIRGLTEGDRDEWQIWKVWLDYKASPEGSSATDELAIVACERDGALINDIQSANNKKQTGQSLKIGNSLQGLPSLQAVTETDKERVNMGLAFTIPDDRFDNTDYILKRLAAVDSSVSGSLKSTLSFLYMTDGPINMPKDRLKISEPFLEQREIVLVRWLQTRTNGSLRSKYGTKALHAARFAKYKCITCGFSDIRALHLDHVDGHVKGTDFACLCANCHNIKSRVCDWSGEKKY